MWIATFTIQFVITAKDYDHKKVYLAKKEEERLNSIPQAQLIDNIGVYQPPGTFL